MCPAPDPRRYRRWRSARDQDDGHRRLCAAPSGERDDTDRAPPGSSREGAALQGPHEETAGRDVEGRARRRGPRAAGQLDSGASEDDELALPSTASRPATDRPRHPPSSDSAARSPSDQPLVDVSRDPAAASGRRPPRPPPTRPARPPRRRPLASPSAQLQPPAGGLSLALDMPPNKNNRQVRGVAPGIALLAG